MLFRAIARIIFIILDQYAFLHLFSFTFCAIARIIII
nr:MAG TPA: hypothetical protein [Caudoviricetes sp.]